MTPALLANRPNAHFVSWAFIRPKKERKAEPASDIAAGSCSSPTGFPSASLGIPSMGVAASIPSKRMSAELTVARCALACKTNIGRVEET